MSDKTSNDYLEAARCLFNWLVRLGRANVNPLLSVEKVKTKKGAAEEIRALSDDEMVRLLAAAGERKKVYLMAVHTGLRASELAALKSADLLLDAEVLFATMGHVNENGGSGGARTRRKSNVHAVHNDAASQIASQAPVSLSPELSQIVTIWSKLSAPLKAAIMAIIKSAEVAS